MRKGSFSQDSRGILAMAGVLLFALCCTSLLGCIIPQDDELVPELPPKRNGPIKIVTTDPTDPRTTYFNTTQCLSLEPSFKLRVEDEDLTDTVYSFWFIGNTNTQPFQPTPVAGGSKTRAISPPSSLGFKSALANLPAGTAVLTVYVADTSFQEVVGGQVSTVARDPKVLADGGLSAADVGTIDSFTWVLDVQACQ